MSGLALAVAFWQARDAAEARKEARTANLTLKQGNEWISSRTQTYSYEVTLTNVGPAPAREIRLFLLDAKND